jgi:hypothetical protein
MGDRSKIEARRASVRRGLEAAKQVEPPAVVVRCRSCRKNGREVRVFVEMGGFVFCNECISAAHSICEGQKAGR